MDVPVRAFEDDDAFYEDGDDPEVVQRHELNSALMSAGRIGGPVVPFAVDKRSEGFLFQFSADVVEVNLGDAGTMYVITDDAFWSCH